MYPLELVNTDFLTIENPQTGVKVSILVITNHCMQYAKAVVTSTQTAKATATTSWNKFVTNYSFPKKLLTNQDCNLEFQLIKELCKLANIQKVQTPPYHPETNGQCKRFNQTLISMIGTLEIQDKQCWKDYLPTLVHAYNCTITMPWILVLII